LSLARCESHFAIRSAHRLLPRGSSYRTIFAPVRGFPSIESVGFLLWMHLLMSPAPATVNLPGECGACALLSMFGGKATLISERRVFLADIWNMITVTDGCIAAVNPE
jgi:hypothetical protein